ncbi:thaumatin-like protein [Tanacetum coccineum]
MAFLHFVVVLLLSILGVDAIVFTLQNRCNNTIWPRIQASGGQPQLMNGGFKLNPLQSRNITALRGWSGRIWGRTRCTFDAYGDETCTIGDCGNSLYFNGVVGEPLASLVEFNLDSPLDFYDVSLTDGFNMPISIHIDAAVFTLQNICEKTIWPGIQPSGGRPVLMEGDLELRHQESIFVTTPTGWSGRNCGSGLYCRGAGGVPPASLAEFTLDSPLDFYDVSLVDGYNMPISILPYDDAGLCQSVVCDANLNQDCPSDLQVKGNDGETVACKSGCTAYHAPEYCCTGQFQNPNTCKPTNYSQYFKSGCPHSYSYAFDDASSTFTCREANYLISFC